MRASAIWLALGLCAASDDVIVPMMELPFAPHGVPDADRLMHADALVELSKRVSSDAAVKGSIPEERVGMQIRAVQAAVDALHGGLERSMTAMLKVATQAEKTSVESNHLNEQRRQQEKMYAAEADDANHLKAFGSALLEKLDSVVKVEDELKSKADKGIAALASLTKEEEDELSVIIASLTELNGTMTEVNQKYNHENARSENVTRQANEQVRQLVDMKARTAKMVNQTRDAGVVCAQLLAFYTYRMANRPPPPPPRPQTKTFGSETFTVDR